MPKTKKRGKNKGNALPQEQDGRDVRGEDSKSEERWRASEPPPDPWGDVDGADADGKWRYEIIGEEVDYEGNIKYEVRWDDWHRPNGTKTTWEGPEGSGIETGPWVKEQRKRRRSFAADSVAVEVPSTTDIHNTATFLRSQAYDEKLARVQKEPQPNRVVEMARLMAKYQAHIHPQGVAIGQGASTSDSPLRSSQRTSTRQYTLNSIASSSTPAARSSSKASVQSSATASSSKVSNSRAGQSIPSNSSSKSSAHPPGRENPKPISTSIVVSSTSKRPANSTAASEASEAERNVHPKGPAPSKQSATPALPGTSGVLAGPSRDPISRVPSTHKAPRAALTSEKAETYEQVGFLPSTPVIDKGKQRARDNSPPSVMREISSMPRKRVKRTAPSNAIQSHAGSFPTPTRRPSNFNSSSTPAANARQVTRSESSEAQRERLSREWTLAARAKGAAPISFFNDVDGEAIPDIGPSFRYLEGSYMYAKGIDIPDSGFLMACSCDVCGPKPATCDCQADCDVPDFAYTPAGLYAFNVHINIEVIECNNLCKCSVDTCINRVSQRPRDVPIQVFKTRTRAWGVRAMVPLQRGKVIGIYAGRLIRREAARKLMGDMAAYCFDLDGDEMVDSEDLTQSTQGMQNKYSVDSRREGNWTRFINHSCSPNLEIYLVVHDKPAGSGMPYIAFVAKQNIPAYTELSFDYHIELASQLALERIKQKRNDIKLPIPEGARKCLCGSEDCRGFLA